MGKRLSDLRQLEFARIRAVHGETHTVARIFSLGFLPGRQVRHSHTALLGDPRAYLVDGQIIAMRRADASCVEIEEVHP